MTAEEQLQAIYAELPKLECQRKCQACCSILVIPRVEYVQLEKTGALIQLGIPVTQIVLHKEWRWMPREKLVTTLPADETRRCSLLKPNGKCRTYDVRPLICRIWGMLDTPTMRCPHGCIPERWLTQKEANTLHRRVLEVTP